MIWRPAAQICTISGAKQRISLEGRSVLAKIISEFTWQAPRVTTSQSYYHRTTADVVSTLYSLSYDPLFIPFPPFAKPITTAGSFCSRSPFYLLSVPLQIPSSSFPPNDLIAIIPFLAFASCHKLCPNPQAMSFTAAFKTLFSSPSYVLQPPSPILIWYCWIPSSSSIVLFRRVFEYDPRRGSISLSQDNLPFLLSERYFLPPEVGEEKEDERRGKRRR